MSKLSIHIRRGERTRTLFCLIAAGSAAISTFMAGPARPAVAASSGYQWPVKPFDQPHPIRGSFGDPRTIFAAPPTEEGLMTGDGTFNFHFGVDIAAPNNTPVFSVETGTVTVVSTSKGHEYVEVEVGNGRSFQYWHIRPAVRLGQRAEAGRTVLGAVMAPREHVHFAELQRGRVVNPLVRGHLTPYVDTTRPDVASISLRRTETGSALFANNVGGRVVMVAEAYDTRQLRIPGAWQSMPVAPARVMWRLQTVGGKLAARGVAADFRRTTPPNGSFWSYYARGTYQNMSVFGSRYSWGQPGRFLFKLTRSAFNTSSVPDGIYDLVVTASDIRGNKSSSALRLTIHNRAGW